MKYTLIICSIVGLSFAHPASSYDFNELNVGDVACIDVFGPWNKVGTIVSMNSSSQEVLLRDSDGQEKWYDASKTRNVLACKVTSEGAQWLLEKGIEGVVSSE